jgi:hypothetical protein
MSLCFVRLFWGVFTTTKRCAGETAQARYCESSAVHCSAGSSRPLGGGRPAPQRADARDPAETRQRTLPARTTGESPARLELHQTQRQLNKLRQQDASRPGLAAQPRAQQLHETQRQLDQLKLEQQLHRVQHELKLNDIAREHHPLRRQEQLRELQLQQHIQFLQDQSRTKLMQQDLNRLR